MINNFDLIRSLLSFRSDDDFYYALVMQRKKEHEELGSNSYVMKSYFIKSLEDFDKNRWEMTLMCQMFNARAYLNLNRRSFKKTAFHTLQKVAGIIMCEDYKSVKKSYTSVCGAYNNEDEKTWIIDVDDFKIDSDEFMKWLKAIPPVGDKFIAKVPTKNGYHLLTKPFNLTEFRQRVWPPHDIQKDNPTLLYIPSSMPEPQHPTS